MRTRYGISPWVDLFPRSRRPDLPRLRGEHTADVVIVGGGLTGCATAYACAASGAKPILIEADRLGQGGAGRTAGLLLSDPGPTFRDVANAHGLRAARRVFESWRRASLDAAALVRRLNIRCDLAPVDDLIVAIRDGEKHLRREQDARSSAGLDARWMALQAARNATSYDASGAIRLSGAFTLDPYRTCLGLAAAARSRGAAIYERSSVTKVLVGKKDVAVNILQTAKQKRIALQIEPDGSQPLEMERTKSWGYSIFNLEALIEMATLGDGLGVDLWNYQTPDGRSIRKALTYLAAFAFNERKWENQQLGGWEPQSLYPLLRKAALRYQDAPYQTLMAKVPDVDAADRQNLLSPKAEGKKQAK